MGGRLSIPELKEERRKMQNIKDLNKIALLDVGNMKLDNVLKAFSELDSEIDKFSKAEDSAAANLIGSIDSALRNYYNR